MGAKKRPRPWEDGSVKGAADHQEAPHPHLVLKLLRTTGGGWVFARGVSCGGEAVAPMVGGRVDGVGTAPAERRLVLVLDLDHTLLHSIPTRRLHPKEADLLRQYAAERVAAGGGGGGAGRSYGPLLFDLESRLGLLTKLRPFVHTFLREASRRYHLCICTMGSRDYAHEMARLLDPDGVYFAPEDIVSRTDFTERGKKGLDVVRRGDERTTVILDDTVSVWEKHLDNLVPVPAYHYFAHGERKHGYAGKSFPELRGDEDECSGALRVALDLLRLTHTLFFGPTATGGSSPATSDVRSILRALRQRPELPRIVAKLKLR